MTHILSLHLFYFHYQVALGRATPCVISILFELLPRLEVINIFFFFFFFNIKLFLPAILKPVSFFHKANFVEFSLYEHYQIHCLRLHAFVLRNLIHIFFSSRFTPATAGSEVRFLWTQWPEIPSTLNWFKIDHAGLNADGTWASGNPSRYSISSPDSS
ncbi:hypothetical protein L211DRAFT_696851 [Terfezia boudieri ATCC MYA-4762]|uniref:Uncharacterized protein n=1 Tax=Terfezia boudieri ATCC MYA-4762 TaxID=1051890 RepID=A0A3N4LX25_9PEZI|nr:hypothetical protein L211DRAFT_696851 [Terfezia boudieri ATCC MYA-4762]